MRRLFLAAVLASAVPLVATAGARAQVTPACATADLGCQLTAGLTNLATSLGASPPATPGPGASTTVPTKVSGALGATAAASSSAVAAVGANAALAGQVVPAVPVGAELQLPALAAPNFGPAPAPVVAAPLARAARARRPAVVVSARPSPTPGPSGAARALAGSVGVMALLFAAALGLRRAPSLRGLSSGR